MNASDIMNDAGIMLLDVEHARWPMSELAGYIDRAVETIVNAKPSASSKTLTVTLASGTKQAVPTTDGTLRLLDIVRNINADDSAGRMVRQTLRSELDANDPNWHLDSRSPYRKEVRQFTFDEILPRTFWVYPGNDGTGKVEAIVSYLPTSVVSQQSGDVDDITTWEVPVGLEEQYRAAVLDYVLYRANMKEDPAAIASKAPAFFQSFQLAIGVQVQVEAGTSPGKRASS